MPELRKDPIVGRWVILAPDRAKRPEDFSSEFRATRGGFCPFCEGHEETTPPEILAYRYPGTDATTAVGERGSSPTNFRPYRSKAISTNGVTASTT